jgi:hypothetical protein
MTNYVALGESYLVRAASLICSSSSSSPPPHSPLLLLLLLLCSTCLSVPLLLLLVRMASQAIYKVDDIKKALDQFYHNEGLTRAEDKKRLEEILKACIKGFTCPRASFINELKRVPGVPQQQLLFWLSGGVPLCSSSWVPGWGDTPPSAAGCTRLGELAGGGTPLPYPPSAAAAAASVGGYPPPSAAAGVILGLRGVP